MEEEYEEEGGRCNRHVSTSQQPYSVCPYCLHDRLSRLCPDCANVLPCTCPSSKSGSSTASSSGSINGSDHGNEKISNLIASEPAFVRSKSVGFALQRSGSVKTEGLERSRSVATGEDRKKRRWNLAAIWPFKGLKLEKGGKKVEKWKSWYFPSPIKVFNYRKYVSRAFV